MKTILSFLVGFAAMPAVVCAAWQDDYARLLKKYVKPSGVNYAAWKADPNDMNGIRSVVEGIAGAKVPGDRKEALALYINAYNAWILHEALEKYPARSVKDPLFTFFISNRITVAGEKMSFNRLEKDVIRPRFKEPRIHFALNCASRSCPPLRNEPYRATELEAQFEEITKAYINSPKGVSRIKDGASVSKIFDWYQEDFAGGVVPFLNKYLDKPLPANAKLKYQEYDWALNDAGW